MQDIIQLKFDIMEAIQKKYPSCKKVGLNQYKMRCPICGDSQSNLKDAHMYLKCDFETDEPILYNCFKGNCNAKGKIDKEFLEKIDIHIDNSELLSSKIYNKIGNYKNAEINILTGDVNLNSQQGKYIEWRLGKGFNYNDYKRFKIVWDLDILFESIPISNREGICIPLNDRAISFLSSDRSILMSRYFTGDKRFTWLKNTIIKTNEASIYSIDSDIDLFTNEDININIAEGIFDILSVYKNFNTGNNSAYIAVLGSKYEIGIKNIINKGLFGNNVNINIYADSDIKINNLKYNLKRYKWLFKEINVYTNILYKDVGTKIENIKLIKNKL